METFDGRKLNHSAREAIRIRAVQRIIDGESLEVIAKTLGYHRSAVYQLLNRYKAAGIDGLKYNKIPGKQPILSKTQKQKIFDIVTSKNPLQLKFEFALWTRQMVRDLILDHFAINLSITSVGRLLHELGLTPQRPLRRPYQQDPERVATWLKEEYPAIKREATATNATIYFGDEAGIRSDYHSGTTWAPKGHSSTGARHSLNLVSAVSAKGGMRYMTVKGKMNAERFMNLSPFGRAF
jgi:transposase